MQTYIQPNKTEQRLIDAVHIPTGSQSRARRKFMAAVHAKISKRLIGISALSFSGAVIAFVFVIVAQMRIDPAAHGLVAMSEPGARDAGIVSSALMANPYEVQNFRCDEGGCKNLVVMNGATQLFSDPTCVTCNEILLWANLNGDRDSIVLAGEATIQGEFVSLPTQYLSLSEYPDWTGRSFPVRVNETGIVLSVTLQQIGEWNLISDVACESHCENIKVGVQRDVNELLIDTCPSKPCALYSIVATPTIDEENNPPESGTWVEDDHWDGGYSVSVWTIPSLFAFNGDHGEEVAQVEYSPGQTASRHTLNFSQKVDGHTFSFDLIPTWP